MSAFHKFFDIQPASNITNPEPTYQKSKSKAPQTLGDVGVLPDVELTDFASRNTDNGRQASVSEFDMPKGAQTPKTPNELEMSRPATPTREDAVGRERMWNAEPMTKWRIFFFLLGFGAAINLALNNVYCANTHPPSVILGLAHGSYGVGGIIAPIIGTAIVSQGILWSRFYFICVGLRLCCIAFAAWSFWSYREDSEETLLEATTSRQTSVENAASKLKNLKLALKNKVTIFGALFIFAYQGAEVSISGWFISYLINYRNGDPAKVGYVTAGFWAGITLGRFVLTHAAPKIGEKKFVVILTIGTVGLQLLAWLTPNLIGNAVAVCLLGLLLGPVYPCAQTIFSRLMPRHVQTTAIGFIGGAGSSGGAVAPFTTGVLAQASGTWVLHPVAIGMYAVMMVCWFALPKVRKRTE
ncbi:unnamed protein product [Alternaria alternata]